MGDGGQVGAGNSNKAGVGGGGQGQGEGEAGDVGMRRGHWHGNAYNSQGREVTRRTGSLRSKGVHVRSDGLRVTENVIAPPPPPQPAPLSMTRE